MPRYLVTLSAPTSVSCVVEVEADDEDGAEEAARGVPFESLDWELDAGSRTGRVEVEDVEEIDD